MNSYFSDISVIIPTLNPGVQIIDLLNQLIKQSVVPKEILIVDSESDDLTDIRIADFISNCSFKNIRFKRIKRCEFDHGKTRDMALRDTTSEIILFLTQDALPKDEKYIENLIKYFDDNRVALVSGRQVASSKARPFEKLVRQYNYPDSSFMRSKKDIAVMGIKAFYASDVCSAYRRQAYLDVGGFDYPLETNEDMFIAAKFLNEGYLIAYASDACVIHSHNFTLKQQFKRNYLMGKEIQKHINALHNVKATSEGINLVKYVFANLWREKHYFECVAFFFDCCARVCGNKCGVRAAKVSSAVDR